MNTLRQRDSLRRGSNIRVPSFVDYRFSDSFTRPDSNDVGGGWTQTVENAGIGYGGQGISNNFYRVYTSYSSSEEHLTRINIPLSSFKQIISGEINIQFLSGYNLGNHNESVKLLLCANPTTRASSIKGLGFFIVGGDRQDTGDGAFRSSIIVDNAETLVSTSGNAFSLRQIDFVFGNGYINLYNYAVGDSRPSTPTNQINFSGKYSPEYSDLVIWQRSAQVGDNDSASWIKNLSLAIKAIK